MDILMEANGLVEEYQAMCKFISYLRSQFEIMEKKEKDIPIKIVLEYIQESIDSYEAQISNTVCKFLHQNVTFN